MPREISKKNDIQFSLTRILLSIYGHRHLLYLFFVVMNALFKQESLQRAGKEYRVNPSRFFFVKTMGWFVYIRGDFVLNHGLISQDGIAGPFLSIHSASKFVAQQAVKNI
jgi:uncharacterized membrane protein